MSVDTGPRQQISRPDQAKLRVFTRWWQSQLPPGTRTIHNLLVAIRSSTLLIDLLEALTGRPVPREDDDDEMRIDISPNLEACLHFCKTALRLPLADVDAASLAAGRHEAVFALTWSLIRRFDMPTFADLGEKDASNTLLGWVRHVTDGYKGMTSLGLYERCALSYHCPITTAPDHHPTPPPIDHHHHHHRHNRLPPPPPPLDRDHAARHTLRLTR